MTKSPRRMKVLQAIVEDYVASHEPVGSKALVERHNLGVSPATVRNEMAALEEMGLIIAPHTSAGRIPTDKGYRFFVDQISEVKPLSAAERRAVQTLLDSSDDVQEIMANTVQVLAQLTRQVAVVQYPHLDTATIRHLELVGLSESKVLVVLILSSGRVDQRVVSTASVVDESSLQMLKPIYMQHLDGLVPHQAAEILPLVIEKVPADDQPLAQIISDALQLLFLAGREEKILLAGTANLTRSPEDFEHSIGPILEALEEQVVLLKLLTEMEQDVRGLSVQIGEENTGSLADTSLVAAAYGQGESAKIGVLGPTRMDYPQTMAAVRAISRYLSRILNQ